MYKLIQQKNPPNVISTILDVEKTELEVLQSKKYTALDFHNKAFLTNIKHMYMHCLLAIDFVQHCRPTS